MFLIIETGFKKRRVSEVDVDSRVLLKRKAK